VFSLGVMLCELLSGVLPYEGAHLPGSKRPARSLRDLLPDAPEVLTQLLSRMVAPDAAERPTMEEVARILTPLAAPKSRTALWAGLGAAGVLMTLGALLLVQGARAPAEPSSYAAAQAQQQALFAQALRTLQQGVLSPEARVRDHALGEAGKTHVGQLLGDVLRVLDAAVTRGDQPTAVTALVAVGALGQPAAVSRLNYLIAAQPQSRGPMGSAPAQAAAAALYALSLDSGRQLLEDALTDPRLASERELRASAARHLLRARAVGRAVQTPLRELAGAVQPSTFVLEHHLPPCSDTVLLASAGDNAARHALLPVFRDYSQGPLCARLAAAVLLRADGPLDSELDEAQKSARKRLLQQADQAGSPEQVPAARELCLAGQADSVPPVLLAAARSGSEPSQLQAVDALAVCGGYTVLPALVPLLTTGSPLVRITAAGAVLRILGEPTDGAGRATGTETDLPSVSVPLAQELEALRLLVQNSQADADALRLDVRTLGSLGMRPVLRALAPRLGDAQPEVRAAALLALAELDTELSGKLPEGERREVGELLHQRAMQAAQPTANSSVSLRAIGLSVLHLQGDDEPIAPLQAMLVGDAPLLVKETIARLAPLRSPLLAQSLASELPASVRLIAAVRLAEAGDGRDAVRAVLGEAVREHGGQALLAYAMLHKLGHAVDSHPDFHAALQPGQRLTVRFDAVSALQWLPLPEAPPLLRIARADPAVVVRSRAIDMVALHLHRCPTPAQRRMLIDVLRSLQSDAEFSVRLKVARTLSQWQSRESTLCDGKVREEITAPQPAPPPALLLRPLPPSAPPSTPALADVPPPAAASAGRTETLTASRPTSPRALVEAQLERVRELERRRNIDEALAVLEALQDRHGDSLSSEQQERIRHAISRMRPNQGGIIIWSPASGACRKQRTQWYLPGPVAIKNPSGGGDIKAFIRRGQIQRVHLCTSGK
jgi:HEAT repeat protein